LARLSLLRRRFFHATLLVTKRAKAGPNLNGGVTNFARFKNDAQRLLYSAGGALVTTMLDYYRLPQDFPGMESRPVHGTPIQRVTHVENAIAQHFKTPQNFVPFLALHEFEAWLFCSSTELPRVLTETRKEEKFEAIRASVASPEDINERPSLHQMAGQNSNTQPGEDPFTEVAQNQEFL
jgi:hypothetical protein